MNNPQAFPRPASEAHQHGMHDPQEGMELRDYFAARAMQALLQQGSNVYDLMAKRAYLIADEMMKAREE